jgi:hypothetical protein
MGYRLIGSVRERPLGGCRGAVDGYSPLTVLACRVSQRAAEIASNTHRQPGCSNELMMRMRSDYGLPFGMEHAHHQPC